MITWDGNPCKRAWLDALSPFATYTRDKQRQFIEAWNESSKTHATCPRVETVAGEGGRYVSRCAHGFSN